MKEFAILKSYSTQKTQYSVNTCQVIWPPITLPHTHCLHSLFPNNAVGALQGIEKK